MNPVVVLFMASVVCLSGCGKGESTTSAQPSETQELAGDPSKSEPAVVVLPPTKPLAELTHEELQERLVGTWQANDEMATVIAFDAQGRIPFFGKSDDSLLVDMDFLLGKVYCQITATGAMPRLIINRPGAKESRSRQFEIQRLADDELELAEIGIGEKSDVVTYKRVDREPIPVIDQESGTRGGT